MATPQNGTQAVLQSQNYFRLKRAVQSPGDIYEVDISAHEIYIGPDSDISEINVQYFNAVDDEQTENATVAVNGPYVGLINARLATKNGATGQPGRILISPVDLVDNTYQNPGSQAHRFENVPAMIDVIVATQPLSSIPAVRSDRTLRLPSVPWFNGNTGGGGNNGSTDIVIPIYGRRMVTVYVACGNIGVEVDMSLVTLVPGTAPPKPRFLGSLITATTGGPTTFKGVAAGVYRASDAGRQENTYDAGTSQPYTLKEVSFESDLPGPFVANQIVASPQVRGLADLLLLNVGIKGGAAGGSGSGSLQFADLFIKLSDRET